ncbi:unnamed protein product [Caretta caretta]
MTGLVLREPELRLVLSAYAADVLLVIQDLGDLARVEACQAIYSAASSARVNWVKSSGLAVGDWRQVSSPTRASDHPVECGSTALSRRLPFRHAPFPARELAKFRGRGDRADSEMDEATSMSLPPWESTGA